MKNIKVHINLSVPESISSNLISLYFDDIEEKLNVYLHDYISDEDEEIECDGMRVYE